ncbi:hypothetical protein [Thiocystis violacea]|uniref:hypothetical protein n=1 Tax=Thiocystis violacea TaxID=13725 RepID=UPI001902FF51|nr:hypothetical protein [Thiocystis violacea]MBK1725379.1 hypothetical protein [Thiocystis violacea]
MSEVNQELLATLGELADEPVEQTGPTGDFVYIDISSIDRETKKISDPKPLMLSQAPSRAKQGSPGSPGVVISYKTVA